MKRLSIKTIKRLGKFNAKKLASYDLKGLSEPDLSRKAGQYQRLDLPLLFCVLLLSFWGLFMVYDSSQVQAFQSLGDKFYFIKQQTVWFILGFISLITFSLINYHRLQKIAVPFLAFSTLLLLMVFIPGLGVSAGGAHRWLRISQFSIQPAEIIKLAAIIYLATLFSKKVALIPFSILTGVIVLIVGVFQKDLGTAVVFSMIALSIYFIAGSPLVYIFGLLLMGIIGFLGFIITSPYRVYRILAFLDPFSDTQGMTYHISQVLIALGSGGIFGLGIGQSRQKFAYIPEVTTDSIFSVIGEEFGFLGSTVFIALIGFLVIRGLKIAERAPDKFGRFLAVGLTVWLGAQAIINIGSMVSLIPLTGVPLPFISYGGSALLANLVAVGILLNVSRQSKL